VTFPVPDRRQSAGRSPGAPAAGNGSLADFTNERNAWIEVDVGALAANVRFLREAVGSGVELIGVVKANAYGHGAPGVGAALEGLGVDRLAVAWVGEGVALRQAGVRCPVLVLGHAYPSDAAAAVANDLTLTCHSAAVGTELSREAWAAGRTARVHIKVDTGLHRFGVDLEEAVGLAEHLRRFPGLEVEGLSTHMANADEEDDSFSDVQDALYREALRRLPWITFRHVANSATALRRPALRYDGVRCGLSLYGVAPPNTPAQGLRPVLSLRARVARVTTVPDGEGASYGLTWRAAGARTLALVPVGYADGWRRSLSGRFTVLVGGRRYPGVGRVAMDQFLVDVSAAALVREGDVVTLIGMDGGDGIGVDEIAGQAGTISWEILAGLQARLPRVFHREGAVQVIFDG